MDKLSLKLFEKCDYGKLKCDACELAKHTRVLIPISIHNTSTSPFHIIHSDVWGPSRISSLSGYKWYVTFIDCYSRVTWVYLIHSKKEVFSCFQMFHQMIANIFDANIRMLRPNNGTEYTESNFQKYLINHGIIHQISCVNTLAPNGVAERKNRHEVARFLLFAMNVPKVYWGEVVLSAAYLINRMPLQILGFKTTLEQLIGSSEYTVPPKAFGCTCFVHHQ